jgi:tRNA-splicing ligase RtcB
MGAVGQREFLKCNEIKRLVPSRSVDRGRYGFGVVPAGNHFLEIQYVEEIIDRKICNAFDIATNGIAIMIHSDGGLVSDDIGNFYGNRSTATGYINFFYNLRKFFFHLRDIKGINNARRKYRYYFGKEKFIAVDPATYEGKRYIKAKDLSMNAGYASRVVTISRINHIIADIFQSVEPEIGLLCDFSHNSIQHESINGREMWVHRHNACRVTEGQLVFLPGLNNTSSYICIGGRGAANYLNSMDHGAGQTIERFKSKKLVKKRENGHFTRAYTNESKNAKLVPHYSDEGIEKVIELLERYDIARPVARLKPIAGYRYKWKGKLARLKERISKD